MLAPITIHNSPLRHVPSHKPRLLLVADSPEQLKTLKAGLRATDFEVTSVSSLEELRAACGEYHDLAIFDVGAAQVKQMLSTLRTSAGHKTIMLLVESSRVINDMSLAGVLPAYRAMLCNHTQIRTLVQMFRQGGNQPKTSRQILL